MRNNNKRKESTRIREVNSSCQFFLAKQRYFCLAKRISKLRTNPINTNVNKVTGKWTTGIPDPDGQGILDQIRLASRNRNLENWREAKNRPDLG